MKSKFFKFSVRTTAETDVINITGKLVFLVGDSKIEEGILVASVAGSTAAITTIEYEEGAVEDLKKAIERIAPKDIAYAHDSKWGDGNGYAHVRAALMKPSLAIPVHEGELVLGTWQQVVLLDFDNRLREREIAVQILGGD